MKKKITTSSYDATKPHNPLDNPAPEWSNPSKGKNGLPHGVADASAVKHKAQMIMFLESRMSRQELASIIRDPEALKRAYIQLSTNVSPIQGEVPTKQAQVEREKLGAKELLAYLEERLPREELIQLVSVSASDGGKGLEDKYYELKAQEEGQGNSAEELRFRVSVYMDVYVPSSGDIEADRAVAMEKANDLARKEPGAFAGGAALYDPRKGLDKKI